MLNKQQSLTYNLDHIKKVMFKAVYSTGIQHPVEHKNLHPDSHYIQSLTPFVEYLDKNLKK